MFHFCGETNRRANARGLGGRCFRESSCSPTLCASAIPLVSGRIFNEYPQETLLCVLESAAMGRPLLSPFKRMDVQEHSCGHFEKPGLSGFESQDSFISRQNF